MHGFEAIPASSASDLLYVPLFRSAQRGVAPEDRIDTRIVVVNPGDEPALIGVRYFGSTNPAAAEACRGETFYHEPVTVTAGARHIFEQRQGAAHDLPADCFGTAVLETADPGQRIVAVVLDETNGRQLLSANGAAPASAAATRVALPLFRRNHVRLTTGIQVMNTGAATATVGIAFSATDEETGGSTPIEGCDVCEQIIEPFQSYTWWPGAIDAIADGTFGSATVIADQPVVVLVNDYPLAGQADPATYLGIAVPDATTP